MAKTESNFLVEVDKIEGFIGKVFTMSDIIDENQRYKNIIRDERFMRMLRYALVKSHPEQKEEYESFIKKVEKLLA